MQECETVNCHPERAQRVEGFKRVRLVERFNESDPLDPLHRNLKALEVVDGDQRCASAEI
jgi:hypothetical protein